MTGLLILCFPCVDGKLAAINVAHFTGCEAISPTEVRIYTIDGRYYDLVGTPDAVSRTLVTKWEEKFGSRSSGIYGPDGEPIH